MGNYNNGSYDNGEKRTPWSRSHFYVPQDGTLADVILDTTGFVERVGFRTTNTATGDIKVCDVTLNAYLGDSKVRRFFGDGFVRDDHRVRFKMSYWRYDADNIEKMGIKEGDVVQVMMHGMKIEEGTTESGHNYKIVTAKTSDSLDLISRSKEKRTPDSAEYGEQAPQQPAANASSYQQVPSGWNAPHAESYVPNAAPAAPAYAAPATPAYSAPYQAPAQQTPVQQPRQNTAPQYNAPQQPQPQTPAAGNVCVNCGTPVDDKVAAYSVKNFGKCLCRTCQKTVGRNSRQQNAPTQTASAQPQYNATQQPSQALVCTCCGTQIDEKVASYSLRKMGRYLCRTCQSSGGNAPAAPQQQPAQPAFGRVGDVDLFDQIDGLDESNPFYS